MVILKRLVVVQSILLNLKLVSSKVYLKPVDKFDSGNMDFDDRSYYFIISPNDRFEPVQNYGVPVLKEALKKYKSLTNVKTQEQNTYSEDALNTSNLNVDKDVLRKKWRNSCDKKASRTCIKACRSAYKIVCGSYRCKKRMKKSFKKECKRNCKSRFVSSVSDESE